MWNTKRLPKWWNYVPCDWFFPVSHSMNYCPHESSLCFSPINAISLLFITAAANRLHFQLIIAIDLANSIAGNRPSLPPKVPPASHQWMESHSIARIKRWNYDVVIVLWMPNHHPPCPRTAIRWQILGKQEKLRHKIPLTLAYFPASVRCHSSTSELDPRPSRLPCWNKH